MTETLERTARPLIRFDDRDIDRSTARRYANDLISRVNKPETNEILGAVADGCEVDAYRLAEAVLDAMRHVSTRFGQSMVRRRAGEKAAHLGYIAHAVLANHADSLPPLEPGARSPRIAELELEIEHAGVVNQQLSADLVEARRQASVARRSIFGLKRAANNEITRLHAEVARLSAESASLEASRDVFAAGVAYATELLPPCAQQRLFGYLDGVERS